MQDLPIWILLPTETPIDKSILFFVATLTAVTCSAALPTIGRIINPMNASLTDELWIMSGMALTRNSAHTATKAVESRSMTTAAVRDISGSASWLAVSWVAGSVVPGTRAAPRANCTALPTGGARLVGAGRELLRYMPPRDAAAPMRGELFGDWELKTVLESREGIGLKGFLRLEISLSPAPSMPAKLGADAKPFIDGWESSAVAGSAWFSAWLRAFPLWERRFLLFRFLDFSLGALSTRFKGRPKSRDRNSVDRCASSSAS